MSHFLDWMPLNNSSNIPSDLRGVCLKSHLFGCALDLYGGKGDEETAS